MVKILLWTAAWHVVTGLGITVGYHRLLTHRSFQCPKWLEYFWATLGIVSLMGPPISWVAVHRFHHANTDKPDDPHSPTQGGWWWSQVGWILHRVKMRQLEKQGRLTEEQQWANSFSLEGPFVKRWAHDLIKDSYYRKLTFGIGIALWFGTVLLSFALGGWFGVIGRVLSTGTLVWSTWFVNSFGHIEKFGYRNFDTKDNSTNVWWVALLSNGEGWHNNHHYRPQSARHGMKWFEFDLSWVCIWTMQKLGLATRVHTFKGVDRAEQNAA